MNQIIQYIIRFQMALSLAYLCVGITNLQAQTKNDNLEKRVEHYYHKFGRGNVKTTPDDILKAQKFKDSLVLLKKYDLLAEHTKTIGKMHQQQGQMTQAESAYKEAINYGKIGKDSLWVAATYSKLGGFYAIENRNFLSLACQQRALDLFEKFEKNKSSIPEVYNDIAKVHIQLGELETAEKYLVKSLELKKTLGDTLRLGIISTLFADIYRIKKDYLKAEAFYKKDIPKRKKQNNYEGLIISYHGLGDTYFDWKKYDKAEEMYLKALAAADTIQRHRTIGLSLIKLGNLYSITGKQSRAEKIYNRAIEECTQVDSRPYQLSAFKAMYDIHKNKGNLKDALLYLEKYTYVNDLNTKETMALRAEDMNAAYALREKENEVRRLDEENKKSQQVRHILIGGILLLILLSAFLVTLYYGRNNVLKSLSKEQDRIKILLHEKEKLLLNLNETHHQLVHSEKMASLGVMTAGIAHELNNPISSIHACAEALKMDYEDLEPLFKTLIKIKENPSLQPEDIQTLTKLLSKLDIVYLSIELKTLLQTIMKGSDRTSEIIQGLKTFSRDTGSNKELFAIEEGIDATLTLLHHKMKDRIDVQKSYHFNKKILCEVSKLNQVFLNIIDNAIHAISDKGTIKIETKSEQNLCIVKISDNGKGMDESTQNKIFEPFYTTKEVGLGTGLGLAISYAIIKEHQGDIKVISTPEHGTSFVITIPAS